MHLADFGPSGQTIHVAPETSEDDGMRPGAGHVDALPVAISQPSAHRPRTPYKSQFGRAKPLILRRIDDYESQPRSRTLYGAADRQPTQTLRLPLNETDAVVADLHKRITSQMERQQQPPPPDMQIPDFTIATLPFSLPEKGRLSAHDEEIRTRRLATLQAVPANRDLFGFYGGEASNWARAEYFHAKKRTELLDVLSFCDELKPRLLADVLVSVSRRHPDLPIFDSPNWSGGASLSDKARHGHILLNPKARRRHRNAKKALRRMIFARTENEPAQVDDVEDEPMPSTWPKAGEGLYAKLAPETDDRSCLMDDGDGESFSQFMVDRAGKPIAMCG